MIGARRFLGAVAVWSERVVVRDGVRNSSRGWLFPGGRPAQHLSATVLDRRLATHHIPNRPARATALVALAQDLPPAVLGPIPGLHPVTAAQWRRRAVTDWTAYLEARSTSRAPGDDTTGP